MTTTKFALANTYLEKPALLSDDELSSVSGGIVFVIPAAWAAISVVEAVGLVGAGAALGSIAAKYWNKA